MVRDAVGGVSVSPACRSLVAKDLVAGRLVLWGAVEGPGIALWALYPSRRLLSARVDLPGVPQRVVPTGAPEELAGFIDCVGVPGSRAGRRSTACTRQRPLSLHQRPTGCWRPVRRNDWFLMKLSVTHVRGGRRISLKADPRVLAKALTITLDLSVTQLNA